MFIDIHAHAWRRPDLLPARFFRFASPEQLLPKYEQIGIERACVQPLVGPEVYLPQANEDILEMAERWPERFIPFCNIDPRVLSNSVDAPLGDLLRFYKDMGCRGLGEFMPNLPFLDPLVRNVFKHCQDVGLPLCFDISDRVGGNYGLQDDPGLPQLEKTLQHFPKLNILCHGPAFWAEIGQLETPNDRASYPKYPIKEEGVVPKMMRRYGNMLGDLSAGSGYNALNRDRAHGVRFLNEFQDKLYFGTDICSPEQGAPMAGLLIEFRDSGKISKETFNKIARENAIRLLGL